MQSYAKTWVPRDRLLGVLPGIPIPRELVSWCLVAKFTRALDFILILGSYSSPSSRYSFSVFFLFSRWKADVWKSSGSVLFLFILYVFFF